VGGAMRLGTASDSGGGRDRAPSSLRFAFGGHVVQITMGERLGIRGRGAFYEQAGTIRDVVQNHSLQVLANVAMEPPTGGGDEESTRDEKVKVLKAIPPLSPKDIVRG
jgi:glucose-6-phosphate 1-dehydrogenase